MSVICVYNNERIFTECLAASLKGASSIELVAIDNRSQAFRSAGAALNYGAGKAQGVVLAFCHQDVFFLDVTALLHAANALMSHPDVGILGSAGVDATGVRGHIMDRFVMLATPLTDWERVDSVDELLFMTTKELWQQEPITEEAPLAWHGYAVEYGLRHRNLGVYVADIPLIHHSHSSNLTGLRQAHEHLAQTYAEDLPIYTSTGTITRDYLQPSRWAHRGLATKLRRTVRALAPTHYSVDVRDPDQLIRVLRADHVHVVNSTILGATPHSVSLCTVQRQNIPFTYWHIPVEDIDHAVSDFLTKPGTVVIATNLSRDTYSRLRESQKPVRYGRLGGSAEFWVIAAT